MFNVEVNTFSVYYSIMSSLLCLLKYHKCQISDISFTLLRMPRTLIFLLFSAEWRGHTSVHQPNSPFTCRGPLFLHFRSGIHIVQSDAGRHCQWLQVCIMWLTLSNQMLEDIANGYRYVSCDSHCPIKCLKTFMWLTLSNQMLEDIANGYRYVSCDTQCQIKHWKTRTLPMVTVMCHVIHNVQSNTGRHCQWLQVCIMWHTLSNQMLEDITNGNRYVPFDSHCLKSNAGRHCQWLQIVSMGQTFSSSNKRYV